MFILPLSHYQYPPDSRRILSHVVTFRNGKDKRNACYGAEDIRGPGMQRRRGREVERGTLVTAVCRRAKASWVDGSLLGVQDGGKESLVQGDLASVYVDWVVGTSVINMLIEQERKRRGRTVAPPVAC
jgi:hypothetical protein